MASLHLDIMTWSAWEQRGDITDPFHDHYRLKTEIAISRGYVAFKGTVTWQRRSNDHVPGILFLDIHHADLLHYVMEKERLTAEVRETSDGYQLVISGSDQAIMLLRLTL